MIRVDKAHFHRLFGLKRPRISYGGKDFMDYLLMTCITAWVVAAVYGPLSVLGLAGLASCVFMVAVFWRRHGAAVRVPHMVKRPQDVVFTIAYKLMNLNRPYFLAVAVLLSENIIIHYTPTLPHHVEWMRRIALCLFYVHLTYITAFRTTVLVAHLRKKDHVREMLMQTAWRGFISKQPSIKLDIVQAYVTGLLTHIVLLAPWYFIITHVQFSLIFLPLTCLASVLIHKGFLKVINAWFYRDHWLGHNSELEFLYLHGTHHDALPCGLIGVAGNGLLEGFLRHVAGFPNPFYSPLIAALLYTIEIKQDIETHQYIPGVFPMLPKEFQRLTQHSTHHFGRLEPYGFGIKLDQPFVSDDMKNAFRNLPQELKNSIALDEQLTGFEWDSPRFRAYLNLVDKYQ